MLFFRGSRSLNAVGVNRMLSALYFFVFSCCCYWWFPRREKGRDQGKEAERKEKKRVNNTERRRRIKDSEKEKRGSPMRVRQREDLMCIVCSFHSVNILVMADFRLPA